MIRIDESSSPLGNNGEATSEYFRISKAEVREAWLHVARQHIVPSRLIKVAFGLDEPTDAERQHFAVCESCRTYFEEYVGSDALSSEAIGETNSSADSASPTSTHDIESGGGELCCLDQRMMVGSAVPDLLREHLHVTGPILFPNDEVALESWQFGRLIQIAKENEELSDQIIETIAAKAFSVLEPLCREQSALLVCFGRVMHRCGVRLATKLETAGMGCPHVVLAHDFYRPTLVCDPREFADTVVVVLVDVLHTGNLLERIVEACEQFGPRSIRGLVVIDQSDRKQLSVPWDALWDEIREVRVTLDEFHRNATPEEYDSLQRYEPNDECHIGPTALMLGDVSPSEERNQLISLDSDLLRWIHETDALKRDFSICGKRYPYVVNVLDLFKKDPQSKQFVLGAARGELADLMTRKVCFAYHAGRASRAGVIAQALSADMQWPVVPIGSRGDAFSLSDNQYRRLGSYNTVVIVDAAIRTGESMAAVTRSLADPWLRQRANVIAFCVLDALSETSRTALSTELGIEIRTLFKLPMSPPTEEVRHWANEQKNLMRERLLSDRRFERVQHALGTYCDPPMACRHVDSGSSEAETSGLLRVAVSHAQLRNQGKTQIHLACREHRPHLIRHLPVEEVVHDRSVQDLLIGVMYNSMKPSFKESAAFALAAARNYEWMTLEWLKCNRPFLTAPVNSWKSVLLVECQMRLSGRKKELKQFRDAAITVRKSCDRPVASERAPKQRQLLLLGGDDGKREAQLLSRDRERQERLIARLDSFIEAAE